MKMHSRVALLLSVAVGGYGVSAMPAALSSEPFPSTYQAPTSPPVLIQGATVLTGTGERLESTDILIANGHIQAIGKGLSAPAGGRVTDAQDRGGNPAHTT